MTVRLTLTEGDTSRLLTFPPDTLLTSALLLREICEVFRVDETRETPVLVDADARMLRVADVVALLGTGAVREFELLRKKVAVGGSGAGVAALGGSRREDTDGDKASKGTESSGAIAFRGVSLVADLKQTMVKIARSQNRVTLIFALKNNDFRTFNNMNLSDGDFQGIGRSASYRCLLAEESKEI